MRRTVEKGSLWTLALLALLAVTGCGGGGSESGSGDATGLKGEIIVDGSSTVGPISIAVSNDFEGTYSDVDIEVGISGTGNGFKKFNIGETDISDASRPIKWSEFELCKENGVHFYELPIAYDGITFAVSNDNDFVDQLTLDQLKMIFLKDKATTWNDINEAWPSEPIDVYAPDTGSGTLDYFKEVIIAKDSGDAIRTENINASEDDNILVGGLADNPMAIGFFGVAYYVNNKDKVRAIPIVNPDSNEPVAPESANIEDGSYSPFSRPIFIYINAESAERTEVKTFVEYYLEHAAEAASGEGNVPLPAEVYAEAVKHFEEGLTGTHYWNADGEAQHGPITERFSSDNLYDF